VSREARHTLHAFAQRQGRTRTRWEKIRVIWQIPELRTKILLTLLMLAIYRIGFQIQLPIIDQVQADAFDKQSGGWGDMLETVALLSASQLKDVTIFGLGIMPYISASIIFQLLASVYPPLEQLQKEGESGRKKINEYTRYAVCFKAGSTSSRLSSLKASWPPPFRTPPASSSGIGKSRPS
jgi:preprotein translocase subunit SecY